MRMEVFMAVEVQIVMFCLAITCSLVGAYRRFGPNVVVEWLTLLHCIREVAVRFSDPATGYCVLGNSWFSSISPGECQDSTLKLGYCRFLPNLFQFINSH
jgi:hypothetical protein